MAPPAGRAIASTNTMLPKEYIVVNPQTPVGLEILGYGLEPHDTADHESLDLPLLKMAMESWSKQRAKKNDRNTAGLKNLLQCNGVSLNYQFGFTLGESFLPLRNDDNVPADWTVSRLFRMLPDELAIIVLGHNLPSMGFPEPMPERPVIKQPAAPKIFIGVVADTHKPRTSASTVTARGGNKVYLQRTDKTSASKGAGDGNGENGVRHAFRIVDSTGQVCSEDQVWKIDGYHREELEDQLIRMDTSNQERLLAEQRKADIAWEETLWDREWSLIEKLSENGDFTKDTPTVATYRESKTRSLIHSLEWLRDFLEVDRATLLAWANQVWTPPVPKSEEEKEEKAAIAAVPITQLVRPSGVMKDNKKVKAVRVAHAPLTELPKKRQRRE